MNLRQKRYLLWFAAFMLFSAPSFSDSISGGGGVHGLAIEYTKTLHPMVNLRIMLSDQPFEFEAEEDDLEYEVEYERTNIGTLIDYRPMRGHFHITGGLFAGDHNWIMEAQAENGQYELGDDDQPFSGRNMELEATVEFRAISPYLGVGWGNKDDGKKGFTSNVDIGFLFTGNPSASFDAKGEVCTNYPLCTTYANASTNTELREALNEEEKALEKEMEDFNAIPVVQFGLGFRW